MLSVRTEPPEKETVAPEIAWFVLVSVTVPVIAPGFGVSAKFPIEVPPGRTAIDCVCVV